MIYYKCLQYHLNISSNVGLFNANWSFIIWLFISIFISHRNTFYMVWIDSPTIRSLKGVHLFHIRMSILHAHNALLSWFPNEIILNLSYNQFNKISYNITNKSFFIFHIISSLILFLCFLIFLLSWLLWILTLHFSLFVSPYDLQSNVIIGL